LAHTEQQSPAGTGRLVSRPALFERLSAAAPGSVVLVCAPAGSGKTMLLRSWAAELDEGVAWVTVDRAELDAQRFWLHLIDALASTPSVDVVERVSPAPNLAGAAVVERLLDQLQQLGRSVWLVIDDLHELESDDARAWLELFLTQIPEQLRVVLATREDPALGLYGLRLAGRLTELRGTDLRFSLDETRALLRESGITLSDESIVSLHERTEGWPAGLRLAALSLATSSDPERFVSEFSGSERTVAGYLLSEVLERQPREAREMLLRTSILERVTGPLADALTGVAGSEAILQNLEEQNAFVTALDAARTTFRYHHLFADMLRLELRRTAPTTIQSLHSTAAAWFEQHGHMLDAVRHAQAAGEWKRAATLLVDNFLPLTMAGRGQTLHALLDEFPPDAALTDGNVAAARAIDCVMHGLLDEGAAHLEVARLLAGDAPPEHRRLFRAYLAVIGLELARRGFDLGKAEHEMDDLRAALESTAESTELAVTSDYRALALMNLGIAELWAARPDAAREHLEDALALTRRIPQPFIEIGCLANLAIAAPLTGDPLPVALELSERAVAIAEEHGWTSDSIATGGLAMAGIALVRMGRLAEAERYLDRADESLRTAADPGTQVVIHHTRGLMRTAEGRFPEAVAEFARVHGLKRLLAGEHVFTVEARGRAIQVRVRMGDVEGAERALDKLDPNERARAGTRIAVAALELERENAEGALEALAPVLGGEAPALYERWSRVEALLLKATAEDGLGDRRAAEDALEEALDLAEPEGLILPFMLWPHPDLLERHPKHRTGHATLISTILDTLKGRELPQRGPVAPLREELSDAELRVVRYLPSNLTASQIASELLVSANTVRTHMRHIYAKLDAHSRSEAVDRARALGLVAPGSLRL
jgi:LuxR family maltose regulon positive regulatory protein